MVSLWKVPVRLAAMLFATGMFVAAPASVARPGTVNYAEGSVSLAGQSIGAKQLGQTEVEPGQVLETSAGKAEMLLTPGVLLRIGDNSAVKMVSPSLTDTRVELLRGEAMVEAAEVLDANRIDVIDHGFDTLIEKKGIYRFDADRPTVAVYDGKAKVLSDDRSIDVKKGREFAFGVDAKPRKFDRDQTDNLYAWSKVRSSYLADANQATVQTLEVGGPGWYGSGWYWSPWYSSWAFVPADGYLFSPFGFGFYSPAYWYSVGPGFYGYYGHHAYPYRYRPDYPRVAPSPAWRGNGGFVRGRSPAMRLPERGGARPMARGGRR